MAYDMGRAPGGVQVLTADLPREEWRRTERLVMLMGASALGALIGFGATLLLGRVDVWILVLIAAPLLALALHLASGTLIDALQRRSYGCATAAILHVSALLAWPMTSLMMPLAPAVFWIAPLLALSSLVLFASCWTGAPRALYRMSLMGLVVAALTAHQGLAVALGA